MSDYKGGYRTEVARFEKALYERKDYEEYLKAFDLMALKGRVDRGEPNPIDPTYGGIGYEYFYPDTIDLGRVKVTLDNNEWNFKWENNRG